MARLDYAHISVDGYAFVEGIGRIETISITVKYAINALPQASVVLAVGRNAVGASEGKSPEVYKLQMYRRRIEIYWKLNAITKLMFKGYVIDVSSKKSNGTFGVVLSAVSWFEALNAGSPFSSGLTSPAALYDIKLPVALKSGLIGDSTVTYSIDGLSKSVEDMINSTSIGDTILNVAKALTSGAISGGSLDVNNAYALAVLNATTAWLDFAQEKLQSITTGFAAHISTELFTVFSGNTLWDSIRALTVSMGFIIVPLINKMYLVPWTPILKKPATTFDATSIAMADNTFKVESSIKTMVLYNTSELTGFKGWNGNTMMRGVYSNPTMESGMIDISPAPSWLGALLSSAGTSENTMTIAAGIKSRSAQTEAVQDKLDNPANAGTDVEFNINAIAIAEQDSIDDVANKYARFLYALRVLNNTLRVTGPIRADIAPGMNLRTNLGEDIGEMDGFVNDVVYNINSENHAASMSVGLSQMRSTSDSELLGMDDNVMWKGVVSGGSIVDDVLSKEVLPADDMSEHEE